MEVWKRNIEQQKKTDAERARQIHEGVHMLRCLIICCTYLPIEAKNLPGYYKKADENEWQETGKRGKKKNAQKMCIPVQVKDSKHDNRNNKGKGRNKIEIKEPVSGVQDVNMIDENNT